jgi:hypothetical protein
MDILNYIDKMQEMYGDKPSSTVLGPRNMYAQGQLVQPSNDGSRPGYAKQKQKFISGPGTGVTALDDPKKYKIVKKYLNKVKTQKNKRIFLDWSEQIGAKPNPWYTKLKKEVKLTRQPLNELINKVISEEFPTAYSGKAGKAQYAREMTVKSFINYWNQNGMFDGNEKLTKNLEQFVTSKKGTPNNYENINRYFTEWRDGKFEVDGVDRKNLDKSLLQSIKNWNPSNKSKRSVGVKQQLIYLNNLSPNLSYDRVANLFAQKFPDNAQTLQHRLNQLTELKRNGVYNDGTGNPKKIPGIGIGERSGWLKEGYGKGFLGNYGRLVKRADELMAAGETKFARRLYNAADKFFSPTGIFTKAAGEGEHPLSRNMGDGPIGNQLKINSLVSGDLNQFKKFNFDSPVRNLVLEYENPKTTSSRKKEIKLEIENRKKLMNILTEGPNQKGIVDSVKFNYGSNKIGASVDVPDIDKIKNFDINEFITRGEEYRKSVLQKGKDVGLIDKKGKIIKQTLGVEQIDNLLLKFAGTVTDKCAVNLKAGGRIGYSLGSEACLKIGKEALDNGLIKGFSKNQQSLAEGILKAGRGMGSMFALRNILGPAAIAFTVAAEAGLVGYDMLATGKSFKEAIGSSLFNYALGDKTKIDNKKLRYKGYADAGISANQIGKISAYENAIDEINNMSAEFDEENRLYNIAANQKGSGRISPERYKKIKQKQIENYFNQADKNKALIQDLARTQTEDRLNKAIDPMVPALMSDADAKRKAMQMTKPSAVMFGNFMDTTFPSGFFSDTTFKEDRDRAINYMPEVQEYYRGNYFAGGGIAGLSGGDKSGPPPESGPASQGLRSLYKNGRKL